MHDEDCFTSFAMKCCYKLKAEQRFSVICHSIICHLSSSRKRIIIFYFFDNCGGKNLPADGAD